MLGKLHRSDSIPYFPHTKNPAFVGCDEILQAMDLQPQKESKVALHGIGGVGFVAIFLRTSVRANNHRKTEIAIEYCYRFWSSNSPVSVFWVSCDSLTKIEMGFRRIAQILDLPGNEDSESDMVQAVSLYFQRGNCQS